MNLVPILPVLSGVEINLEKSDGMREMRSFSPQLGGINCPTTIIVGEEDEPFLEPSKDMAQVMAGSNLVIIPLAAHCPQYENAPAWREAIAMHFADIG